MPDTRSAFLPSSAPPLDSTDAAYGIAKLADWFSTPTGAPLRKPTHFCSLAYIIHHKGPSALPETTNAQESMHRLYYMISKGKQCVMVGFVELFTFVKSLKEDWNAVIKGVAISYGTRKQKDVGLSMGQAPKRRRQKAPVNDGRPPNTTDALVDKRSAKLGCPVGSTNHDKNPFSTYPLYHALQDKPAQKNCLEPARTFSLLSLAISTAGQRTSSRCLGRSDRFLLVRKARFMASLDPKLHKSPFYKQLFQYNTHRTFTCEMSPKIEQKFPDRARRSHHVITVSPALFNKNKIPYSNVPRLFDEWEKQGLGFPLDCFRAQPIGLSSLPLVGRHTRWCLGDTGQVGTTTNGKKAGYRKVSLSKWRAHFDNDNMCGVQVTLSVLSLTIQKLAWSMRERAWVGEVALRWPGFNPHA
ncbi:hypothetical protein PSTG_02426 [Puccinia striiformis f. sp. tritici PST-78]|uniref:Uncharacterized protein n=1 Tax=Puccinia striiformis f. sp. tritici PST-78 TaxID=1165861 RepID=A0A0L0VZ21_9BASI|nr:hypothetical protein PSTG_02426 [Puccinia striiformis f. sp. tritici PST-78]